MGSASRSSRGEMSGGHASVIAGGARARSHRAPAHLGRAHGVVLGAEQLQLEGAACSAEGLRVRSRRWVGVGWRDGRGRPRQRCTGPAPSGGRHAHAPTLKDGARGPLHYDLQCCGMWGVAISASGRARQPTVPIRARLRSGPPAAVAQARTLKYLRLSSKGAAEMPGTAGGRRRVNK